MRRCLRRPASQVVLWAAAIVAAVSSGTTVGVKAQTQAMRWDGLIELVSGTNNGPVPSFNPATPARCSAQARCPAASRR